MKWLAGIAVVTGAMAGCAGSAAQRDGETLDQTIQVFNENMRWERFEKAALWLPPRQRAQAIDDWDERSKDVKITDWEVVKVDPHGAGEAHAQVKLSWYRESEQIVRETRAVQTWEKHGHAWIMVDETRLRGDEMPGLPEAHVDVPKRQGSR
jgi:hypothetical protein|nr:hypothetical protein [Kofleriaceae bacterium]